MVFGEKLKETRMMIGISQEKVAEALHVTRQAVTKWESGTAMPDIDNLIQLSNLLQIPLDYLVKDSAEYVIKPKSALNMDYSHVIAFLVEAKKETYAAGKITKTQPSRLASIDFAYEKGAYKYLDTYVGGPHFCGEEVVWRNEKPIWAMNYAGRVLDDKLGKFLKEALAQVPPSAPYRGPEFYRNGKLTYINTVEGSFEWFQGNEKIYHEDDLIHELYYHGGIVK